MYAEKHRYNVFHVSANMASSNSSPPAVFIVVSSTFIPPNNGEPDTVIFSNLGKHLKAQVKSVTLTQPALLQNDC